MSARAQLYNLFSYHPPKDHEAVEKCEQIRAKGLEFAELIVDLTPASADQSAAIRKVREAVMTANAAIACEGK